jgi:hypothetical protein
VVDGPGDAGFLVQGARGKEEAEHFFQWLEDVEAAKGAVVLATSAVDPPTEPTLDPQTLYGRPGVRGGFVRSIDAD